jgi:hypothetical protein
MASWQEIIAHIESQYTVNRMSENMIALTFGFDDGRSQAVAIHYAPSFGPMPAHIRFFSPLGDRKKLKRKLGDILEESGDLPFGVTRVGDWVGVVHTALADTIDGPEIDVPLGLLAGVADEFERKFTGGDEF